MGESQQRVLCGCSLSMCFGLATVISGWWQLSAAGRARRGAASLAVAALLACVYPSPVSHSTGMVTGEGLLLALAALLGLGCGCSRAGGTRCWAALALPPGLLPALPQPQRVGWGTGKWEGTQLARGVTHCDTVLSTRTAAKEGLRAWLVLLEDGVKFASLGVYFKLG